MREPLIMTTKSKEYPIFFEDDFNNLFPYLKKYGCNEKLLFITDSNVAALYQEEVQELAKFHDKEILFYVVSPGEGSKSISTAEEIYRYCIQKGISRKSTLVALGGGIIGDLTGYVASTFMRGTQFVQCPTTLLSQSDSSVGGKVGVNFDGYKNLIGAFYQPVFVYMGLHTLRTLPQREFSAGMAEVIKHGCIADVEFLRFLEDKKELISSFDVDTLAVMNRRNCEIKGFVVAQDEDEKGLRAILNFGHTFGHSIESLKEFTLVHGETVAIGMAMALFLSRKLGNITEVEEKQVLSLIESYGLPINTEGLKIDEVYEMMFSDKKNSHGIIKLILLSSIGEAYITAEISRDNILEAIDSALN